MDVYIRKADTHTNRHTHTHTHTHVHVNIYVYYTLYISFEFIHMYLYIKIQAISFDLHPASLLRGVSNNEGIAVVLLLGNPTRMVVPEDAPLFIFAVDTPLFPVAKRGLDVILCVCIYINRLHDLMRQHSPQ